MCNPAILQNIPTIHCGHAADCEPAITPNVPEVVARNGSFEQAEKKRDNQVKVLEFKELISVLVE